MVFSLSGLLSGVGIFSGLLSGGLLSRGLLSVHRGIHLLGGVKYDQWRNALRFFGKYPAMDECPLLPECHDSEVILDCMVQELLGGQNEKRPQMV